MPLIDVDDLTPFATIPPDKAQAMVDDATAMAVMAAPCLGDESTLTPVQLAASKAILRGAILRWEDAGSGVVSTQAAGPYSQSIDTRQVRRAMFWPSEITALQKVCIDETTQSGAFSIDTAASEPMRSHAVFFGSQDGFETVGAVAFDDDDDSYFGEL